MPSYRQYPGSTLHCPGPGQLLLHGGPLRVHLRQGGALHQQPGPSLALHRSNSVVDGDTFTLLTSCFFSLDRYSFIPALVVKSRSPSKYSLLMY